MTSTSPIYYQAADGTLRYASTGRVVPDDAAIVAELDARGMLRPDGAYRIVDHRAVSADLTAAALTGPVLPLCGPCAGRGVPAGVDPLTGPSPLPVAERCPDCGGSGRGPLTLTVGRVELDRSDDPTTGHVECWHGVHPSDGAGVFLLCDDPARVPPRDSTRPWVNAPRLWSFVLWPGWEDGTRPPRGAFDGPGYRTRGEAVAALLAACTARYGPGWDLPEHVTEDRYSREGRGMWWRVCRVPGCGWRSTMVGPGATDLPDREAREHQRAERAAATATPPRYAVQPAPDGGWHVTRHGGAPVVWYAPDLWWMAARMAAAMGGRVSLVKVDTPPPAAPRVAVEREPVAAAPAGR